MAIRLSAGITEDIINEKLRKTEVLQSTMQHVRGSCYVCWLLKGEFISKDNHQPIIGCLGKQAWGMGWHAFKERFIRSFPKCHFCTSCGLPQDVKGKHFAPASHTGFGHQCPVQDMVPLMLFAIKRSSNAWTAAVHKFGLLESMSDEQFADWSKEYDQRSPSYYQGLEVVIWFIETYRFRYRSG
jgi:hypothetical protein